MLQPLSRTSDAQDREYGYQTRTSRIAAPAQTDITILRTDCEMTEKQPLTEVELFRDLHQRIVILERENAELLRTVKDLMPKRPPYRAMTHDEYLDLYSAPYMPALDVLRTPAKPAGPGFPFWR